MSRERDLTNSANSNPSELPDANSVGELLDLLVELNLFNEAKNGRPKSETKDDKGEIERGIGIAGQEPAIKAIKTGRKGQELTRKDKQAGDENQEIEANGEALEKKKTRPPFQIILPCFKKLSA